MPSDKRHDPPAGKQSRQDKSLERRLAFVVCLSEVGETQQSFQFRSSQEQARFVEDTAIAVVLVVSEARECGLWSILLKEPADQVVEYIALVQVVTLTEDLELGQIQPSSLEVHGSPSVFLNPFRVMVRI